jgi:hypothetical protein
MKKYILLSFALLFLFYNHNLFGQKNISKANKIIIKYVESVIGKTVDRGECWDLANEALILVNGKWDHEFKYGKLLNPKKDTIFPGDIIQFKNVLTVIKTTHKDGSYEIQKETMAQHTAIVYKVNDKGDYEIAHQNTGFSGKKVGISRLILKTIKKGKVYIYRPVVE